MCHCEPGYVVVLGGRVFPQRAGVVPSNHQTIMRKDYPAIVDAVRTLATAGVPLAEIGPMLDAEQFAAAIDPRRRSRRGIGRWQARAAPLIVTLGLARITILARRRQAWRRRSNAPWWGMDTSRTIFASMLLVVGLACGPFTELDSDSSSGTAADPTMGEGGSADESGSPNDACGVGDTELIGGGPVGPLGFPPPCDPSQDPGTNGYRCCSDDPAAPDGQLPAYVGKGIEGAPPLFSGESNEHSRYGMCVDVTQIAGQGLVESEAENCPIPCNPTWPQDSIDEVCGPSRSCCQTVELQPEDCVMDPSTGLYRPVTGDDVFAVLTLWMADSHATHQDPNAVACMAFVDGDTTSDAFTSCVAALGVANQRGYCMALAPGAVCPHAEPGYVDACEQLNGG
jgi:hypothetical protein